VETYFWPSFNVRTIRGKNPVGWQRAFDDLIDLPRSRQLVTLQDAGNYITKLPKAEHTAPEWQDAMQALILVATRGGPTMLARIGVMRALRRNVERVFSPSQRCALGKAEAEAGQISLMQRGRFRGTVSILWAARAAVRLIG
jgi:hypothetical protein